MKRLLKEMFIIGAGGIALIYLLNPTAGLLEFIPDVIPVIGNLDEAAAVLILVNTAAYYGIDLSRLYGGSRAQDDKSKMLPPEEKRKNQLPR